MYLEDMDQPKDHDYQREQSVDGMPDVVVQLELLAVHRSDGDEQQTEQPDPPYLGPPGGSKRVEKQQDIRVIDQQDERMHQHERHRNDREQMVHFINFPHIKDICQKGQAGGGDELEACHGKPQET